MIRFGTCKLLAGLTILIVSCSKTAPFIQLLSRQTLSLPSASAIVYSHNKLWIFGDDSPYLMSLSTDYRQQDSTRFWPGADDRIPKAEKPDIESAYINQQEGQEVLIGLGSMSAPSRWSKWSFDLNTKKFIGAIERDSTKDWPGVPEKNIEGACLIKHQLIMANRGNTSHTQNHLLIWNDSHLLTVKQLMLPKGKLFAGVSDLCYVPERDLLLLTASEENTANAYEDGIIGESYLGWIEGVSRKIAQHELKPDGWLQLSKSSGAFTGQKIEGLCVEKIEGKNFILHFVSDNDGKPSQIFKVLLRL